MTLAETVDQASLFAFAALLIAAALNDAATFRIPNRLVLALVALYPLHLALAGAPGAASGGLLAGAVVLAGGTLLFRLGLVGGGDAKLAAAIALWAGPAHLPAFLVVAAVAGGLLALFAVGPARLGLIYAAVALGCARARDMLLAGKLPYGVAIAAGGLFVAARLSGA